MSDSQKEINKLVAWIREGEVGNGSAKAATNGHATARVPSAAPTLTDQEVLRLLFGEEKRGHEFEDVYNGNYEHYHPSPSEAVGSLLWRFAFYTGKHAAQMERLIRSSALPADKFDDRRKGKTWLAWEIQKAIDKTTDAYTPKSQKFYSFESYREGVSNETFSLPFRTAKHIAQETPKETKWIARPWFAQQTITEVAGAIKRSGKTTFLTCAARKILDGADFMGVPTTKPSVVYLTEQGPTSFRNALKTAKLEDSDDFHVLYWHDTVGMTWPEVVQQATDYAKSVGAQMLMVDVISRWTGLEGESENNAGAAMEAMRPLKEAVGRGLTVAYARHDRKGGGDVGESGRGSSQFGGDADQLLHLKRPEGNTRKTVRVLEAVGRFEETPESINIELDLDTGEYRSLGDSGAFVEREAMAVLVDILPATPENAWDTKKVVDRAGERDCKRSAVINALNKLAEAGTIQRIGEGKRGNPHRYFKPLPGGDAGREEDSFESPTHPPNETQTNLEPIDKANDSYSFETHTPIDQTNKTEPSSDDDPPPDPPESPDSASSDDLVCKAHRIRGCKPCYRDLDRIIHDGMLPKFAVKEVYLMEGQG